ncbi:MAG: hypothetical protein AAF478_10155 [Pseudomonadota bacterium]
MASGSMRLLLFAASSLACVISANAQTTCLHEDSYILFDGGLPPNGTLVATSTLPDGSNTATWTTTQVSGTSSRPIYQQGAVANPTLGLALGGGVQDLEISYLAEVSDRRYRLIDIRENFESYIITGYTAANVPVYPSFLSLIDGAQAIGANNNQIIDSDGGDQADATFTFNQSVIRVTFENVNIPPTQNSFVVIQEQGCAPVSSLQVSKDASASGFPAGDLVEVPAGTVITYEYVVENTGTVPILDIHLSDVHNGSGPAPVAGSETLELDGFDIGDSIDGLTDGVWDILGPGDTIRFEGTYTVTQNDVDTLQ